MCKLSLLVDEMTPMSLHDPPSSTIHQLPPEILAHILDSLCHPPKDRSDYYWDCLRDQYSCIRVCHYWQQVIDSTPNLWTDVTLETRSVYKGIANPSLRLEKSRRLAITVMVSETARGKRPQPNFPFTSSTLDLSHSYLRESWAAVTQHLDRIETLSFEYYHERFAHLLVPLPGFLPRLDILIIHAPDISISDVLGSTCGVSLREIDIYAYDDPACRAYWGVSPSKLEVLRVGDGLFLDQELVKFLSRAPNLRELLLDDHIVDPIVQNDVTIDEPSLAIFSPVLESAYLPGYHFAMVSLWEAPKLVSLHVWGGLFHCPEGTTAFSALQKLDLTNLDEAGRDALGNFLSGMPSLRQIALDPNAAVVEKLFYSLIAFTPHRRVEADEDEAERPILCPELCEVTLICSYLQTEHEVMKAFNRVGRFVRSRHRKGVDVVLRLSRHSRAGSASHKRAYALRNDHPRRILVEIERPDLVA